MLPLNQLVQIVYNLINFKLFNLLPRIESITLLSLYGVYIVIMYFNAQISHLVQKQSRIYIKDSLTGSGSSTDEKLARKATRLNISKQQQSSKQKQCSCRAPSSIELSCSDTEDHLAYEQRPLLVRHESHALQQNSAGGTSPPPAYQANGHTYHQHHIHSKPHSNHSSPESNYIIGKCFENIQLASGSNRKLIVLNKSDLSVVECLVSNFFCFNIFSTRYHRATTTTTTN